MQDQLARSRQKATAQAKKADFSNGLSLLLKIGRFYRHHRMKEESRHRDEREKCFLLIGVMEMLSFMCMKAGMEREI